MTTIASLADKRAAEAEMPVTERWQARSLYQQLAETAGRFPERAAVTFQLRSGPRDKAVTLTWGELRDAVTRAANLFRRLGVGDGDTVAFLLPNGIEAAVTLLAGATAGIVNPVNPLLAPEHIAQILRDTRAKVVVTLAPFPKSDLAEKVAAALAEAPGVETVLTVDLAPLPRAAAEVDRAADPPEAPAKSAPASSTSRPRSAAERGDALGFAEPLDDRVCAYFHTGGTTGLPKIAQHRASGILYNGWCGRSDIFTESDVLMCPLPLFHVFAAYPILMSCLVSGAQMVMPTPQGYRGDGVFDNFWKLIERHKITFLIAVPTAVAALMQRKVDADVSTLRFALSGSAAMPVELFHRFEEATGVTVIEGYGLTEATCLVAVNPPFGERRVGSVGLPFPYTEVRILDCAADGAVRRECAVEEVGRNLRAEPRRARRRLHRPGPQPRADWRRASCARATSAGSTPTATCGSPGGRRTSSSAAGTTSTPAMIEEAMMQHPAVAFAGAIGQPDGRSGELPCVYVELVAGAEASVEALLAHARDHIPEPAAVPKHLEILPELPKTAVGKVFKPDLRRRAIARTFDAALAAASSGARVAMVEEDRRRGLVAVVAPRPGGPGRSGGRRGARRLYRAVALAGAGLRAGRRR